MLYRGHALAGALATSLRKYGWLPDIMDMKDMKDIGLVRAPEHGVELLRESHRPVVLVEDDLGELSEAAIRLALAIADANRGLLVVVAGSGSLASILRIVAAGAIAINADQPYRRVLASVHEVLRAGAVPPHQHDRLLADLRQRTDEGVRFGSLTAQECAVLADLASGLGAASIAESRQVGLSTIRSQIASVLSKLGVRSQAAAVALTYRSCTDPRIAEPLALFHQNYG